MNKTQKKIIDAAFEILSQDISAPLEKIADLAGVTRMTLHRYYNGRKALLEAASSEMFRLGNEIIDNAVDQSDDPYEQLKAIIMEASLMGERFHFLMHVHEEIDHEILDDQVQELDDKMISIFEALREKNLIRKEMPNTWLLHLYGGIMTAAWSSLREGAVARKAIPHLAWQSFAQGTFVDNEPR